MSFKCIIPPNQSSYSVKDGTEVIRVKLDGGKGRYRRDILNSTSTVNVAWTVGADEYEYLRAFYKVMKVNASTPFKIDLILDSASLTEHDAFFIPDTMQLQEQKGLTYIVAAQLEVVPLPQNYQNDDYLVNMWQEFGADWPVWADKLDTIVNVDWPGAL